MIHRGGLPYGPEIEKLDAAFPVPSLTEGRVIPSAEIQQVLGLKAGPRYYAVVNSWRGKQRAQRNIILEYRDGGLKVLPPGEVLDVAETSTHRAARHIKRAVRKFGWVDRKRLDESGQRRYDHTSRVATVMAAAVEDSKKKMAIELPAAQSLPRRAIEAPNKDNRP